MNKPLSKTERLGLPAPKEFVDFEGKSNIPAATLTNARIALYKLGSSFSYDAFRDKRCADALDMTDDAGQISDEAISAFRLLIRQKFKFDPGLNNTWQALMLVCREHSFHPVLDYLDGQKWDGVERIETWLIDYMEAADTAFVRYISRMVLVASVRRIKQPGCKYDFMVVLEGSENKGKSFALAKLYGDENFSDQSLLGVSDKEVQEATRGRWCIECAELAGMKRGDVDRIKAQITRQSDRGRPAYGRAVRDVPRQCVLWGTTNDTTYLRSQTGNRRFLPIRVTANIDLAGIERDRDQLWAEAVALEATGFSIALPEELWDAAKAEQELRTRSDPWEDKIADYRSHLPDGKSDLHEICRRQGRWIERVASGWLLDYLLEIPKDRQNSDVASRLRLLMAKQGWSYDGKTMRIGRKTTKGYWRELEEWEVPASQL